MNSEDIQYIDFAKVRDREAFDLATKIYGPELMQRQIELERYSAERGEIRWHRQNERLKEAGRFNQTVTGKCAVATHHDAYRDAIDWQLNVQRSGARAKWKTLLIENGHLNTGDIATIALRTILAMCAASRGDVDQQGVARKIMDHIKAEIASRVFAQAEPIAMRERMRISLVENANADKVARDLKHQMKNRMLAYNPPGFEASGAVMSAGLALLHILIDAVPGLVSMSDARYAEGSKRKKVFLSLHPDFVKQIEDRDMQIASVAFSALPLLVPPRSWGTHNLSGGGYYSTYIPPYPLVKKTRRLYAIEVQNTDRIDAVCDAVNALQETPWRINKRLVDIYEWLYHHDQQLIPKMARRDNPPKPTFSDWEWENQHAAVRKKYRKWHLECEGLNSLRLQSLALMSCARMFENEDAIYFAWDLDSRGRAYATTSTGLSPQGPKWGKAMLQFALGTRIKNDADMDGVRFVAATAYGEDKLPVADRIQWTRDNIDELVGIGYDPRSNLMWTRADDPALFLSACFELADYDRDGLNHVTRLPCAVDATCSGLQVLAALSRCETTGRSVNLTSSPIRHDIYAEVADGPVRKTLEDVAAGKLGIYKDWPLAQEFAQAALEYGFDRALTKRVTMTVSYAAKEDSCRRYIKEYYHDRLEDDRQDNPDAVGAHPSLQKFSTFMARVVWNSLPIVVVRGLEIMRWLQDVSTIAVKANKRSPIQWDTPDGFVGRTCRPKERTIQPRVYIYDYRQRTEKQQAVRSPKLTTVQWTETEDVNQHRNSCAPNVVHALDSTHMRMVVRRWASLCKARSEVPQLAMVHDSFGVTSRDFRKFNEVIREEFVRLYQDNDPLEQYEICMRELAGPDAVFPPRPERGNLDLREILSNEFFFS